MLGLDVILTILGITICSYFAFKMRKSGNLTITFFFISVAFYFLIHVTGHDSIFSILISQTTWLLAPLLYLFISDKSHRLEHSIYHFIPIVLFTTLIVLRNYGITPINIYFNFLIYTIAMAIHSVIYIFLSAFEVKTNKWKKGIIISNTLVLILIFMYQFKLIDKILSSSLIIVCIFCLGYLYIYYDKHLKTASSPNKKTRNKEELEEDKKLLQEIYTKILNKLVEEKLYLNQNLKLSDLTSELRANEKLISKAINTHSKENFNAFVNRFRVNHATTLINNGNFSYYTIDAIAEESGFSNKVSFYKAFKRIENISPSQYRENAQNLVKQATS